MASRFEEELSSSPKKQVKSMKDLTTLVESIDEACFILSKRLSTRGVRLLLKKADME